MPQTALLADLGMWRTPIQIRSDIDMFGNVHANK